MAIRLSPKKSTRPLEELVQLIDDMPPSEPAVPPSAPGAPASPSNPANTDDPLSPPFLSLKEAADWLCVSVSTVKRMIQKNELTTVRVGARRKVPAGSLASYVARDVMLPNQVTDTL